MATGSAQDKTAFQSRRFLENERVTQPPKKKRFDKERLNALASKLTLPEKIIRNKKKVIIVTALVLIAVGGGVYEYKVLNSPAVQYAHKLQTMTEQVSKYMMLPKDETPVVATVTDTSILPKETFFQQAKNGDKILMYKKHKLAVLYRPRTGQVITRATLVFQDVTPTPVKQQAVAGASTSAVPVSNTPVSPQAYHPQGKILVAPQH